MIEQVMKEVAAAEQRAEEIVKAARDRAKEISDSALQAVEQMKKEHSERLKARLDTISSQAEQDGEEKAAATMREAKVKIGDVVKQSERAFVKCVETVSEQISKL